MIYIFVFLSCSFYFPCIFPRLSFVFQAVFGMEIVIIQLLKLYTMETIARKNKNSSAVSVYANRLLLHFTSIAKALVCPLLLMIWFGMNSDVVNAQIQSDSVYHVVDKQPAFKGKPSDVQKFIKTHLVYPEEAWLQGVEGVVKVSFVVTRDGQVLNSKIEESMGAELDMEALRVIDLMQNWKPGMIKGQPVNTLVSIPVLFKLQTEERDLVNTLKKYGLSENPPMYVIDDKIVNTRIHLPSYNLKSIRVLKGDQAVAKYGENARNGVVIITTKRGTPPVR